MPKILIFFGTRPEAIKMASLIHEFQSRNISYKVCVTAQHREMLDQALDFFEITPDYDLNLMKHGQSLNSLSSGILASVDQVLEEVQPEMVLVHGDTTTSFITALASFHKGIKIGHVEAGLRTYDRKAPFPEEANRQLTARLSDVHFAPTEGAKENLLNEKIPVKNIIVTGNTIVDSLQWGLKKLENTTYSEIDHLKNILSSDKKMILVTGHRRENFGGGLEKICGALLTLAKQENIVIMFPVHLNPKVLDVVRRRLSGKPNIYLMEPVSYRVMLYLMNRCSIIISDSGGIQEEAPTLRKPVLVTRRVSERMEGVEAGFSFLVGTNEQMIVERAESLLENSVNWEGLENPYGDGRASRRIADYLTQLKRSDEDPGIG